jgi:hypothetical protein
MPLNGEFVASSDVVPDTLTDYTPTWTSTGTQPAIGNGTVVGSYFQVGCMVWFYLKITLGGTSTVGTGNYLFSLPVAPGGANTQVGSGAAVDGTSRYVSTWYINSISGTGNVALVQNAAAPTIVGAATPFVPGSGDYFIATGWYSTV